MPLDNDQEDDDTILKMDVRHNLIQDITPFSKTPDDVDVQAKYEEAQEKLKGGRISTFSRKKGVDKKEEVRAGIQKLKELASQGHAPSMFDLAQIALKGKKHVVPRDKQGAYYLATLSYLYCSEDDKEKIKVFITKNFKEDLTGHIFLAVEDGIKIDGYSPKDLWTYQKKYLEDPRSEIPPEKKERYNTLFTRIITELEKIRHPENDTHARYPLMRLP